MIQKKRWLAFLLAFFVPGLGHLYLGFNRRGLQFMIGCFACIAMIQSMPLVFPFALAVLWFYQLFDALQKATWLTIIAADRERAALGGETYLDNPWNFSGPSGINHFPQEETINPIWLGGACVVAGFLFLIITMFPSLWDFLKDRNITSILLSAGLIGYGLLLLKKNYRKI